ncbi:MAG: primosomal protein N', partial [bacterium]|nr:primosomal protein N' [bacterium]
RIFQDLPKVELVDMREESKAGNFTIFSEKLIRNLGETLSEKRQAILFINRRGSATSMICKDCGKLIVCARCSVPVVYHERKRTLICQHCERQY